MSDVAQKGRGRPSTKIAIYALRDERGAIRYVGKAQDPVKRFREHIRLSKTGRTPLYRWLNDQIQRGLFVWATVLEWVSPSQWESAERRLIAKHRASGDLLNVADGGNEPKNAEAQGPAAARIAHLKRTMARAIKDPSLPEPLRDHMREIMRYAARKRPEVFRKWASL